MNYNHININERSCIYQFLTLGLSIRGIAKALHRSPSTISREIKRNSYRAWSNFKEHDRYFPVKAQEKYEERRTRCHRPARYQEQEIHYIKEKIENHWSPEQLVNRAKMEKIKTPSTATVYRMIHRGVIPKIKMEHLRRKGRFKRPAETRGKFNDGGRTIKNRPKDVYKRQELGHWEGDTVESGRNGHTRKSRYCFVTLAERKSRFYIAIPVEDRTAKNVTPAIIEALGKLPSELVKTITFDRGKEFAEYEKIEAALGCKTYFCDPYCAWQKGTNENTNGLLREFYPKGMDLSEVDPEELKKNLNLLNNRPRKCIKYKTPKEELLGNSF